MRKEGIGISPDALLHGLGSAKLVPFGLHASFVKRLRFPFVQPWLDIEEHLHMSAAFWVNYNIGKALPEVHHFFVAKLQILHERAC